MTQSSQKPMLAALKGSRQPSPPIWLMRQAGRYLPEYRASRSEAGSFLDLCYTPSFAAEVTLQPIRRFGFDASIIFSDILVIPHALGQGLDYRPGEGPVLDPIRTAEGVAGLREEGMIDRLAPVYETLARVRQDLPAETTLIGFAGAPWTLAAYMVEGRGSKDYAAAKAFGYGDPDSFQKLIALLVRAVTAHLAAQADAGAEALQIFDSWAGVLPPSAFRRWVIEPTAQIAAALRQSHPHVPLIGFPRTAGIAYVDFARETGVNALSLDTSVPPAWAAEALPLGLPVQGNLDPIHLVAGGQSMREETEAILRSFAERPHIFNLGHGVVPQTPPEHVAELISIVRDFRG